MKKILTIVAVSFLFVSCNNNNNVANTKKEPLSGTFSSHDEKAEILWRNMNSFAKADFSYAEELLTSNFSLKSAGDTNDVANGPAEAIEYWNGIHSIYENITFDSEGRLMTFVHNNGEVWSAYFGEFYADGKFSEKKIVFPIHVWIQWEGDKIIRQVDMLDSKFLTEEMMAGSLK